MTTVQSQLTHTNNEMNQSELKGNTTGAERGKACYWYEVCENARKEHREKNWLKQQNGWSD